MGPRGEVAVASPTPFPTFTPTFAIPTALPVPTATAVNIPTPRAKIVTYIVKAGDTLSSIAKEYGTTVEAIIKASGLKDQNVLLKIGQELTIPLIREVRAEEELAPEEWGSVITYTVRAGDTLSVIAQKYGVKVKDLMEDNDIADERRLKIGQELIVRTTPLRTPSAESVEITHIVRQGETLASIASYFHRSVAALMEANAITNTEMIRVGQKLIIPPASGEESKALTALLTPPATPASKYETPFLLWPKDGQVFQGPEAAIMLSWASVGILARDEWYLVTIRYDTGEEIKSLTEWTKATSWHLPASLYPPAERKGRLFQWDVVVIRKTAPTIAGTAEGIVLSPKDDPRNFTWE